MYKNEKVLHTDLLISFSLSVFIASDISTKGSTQIKQPSIKHFCRTPSVSSQCIPVSLDQRQSENDMEVLHQEWVSRERWDWLKASYN